jgi:predicted TIM-barrel fold metal-dependent hydrolase
MNVLMGHSGGYDSWELLDEAMAVARRLDNVYLDICAMGRHYGALEYMVGNVGAEKIVYGSDAPFHDWSAEIAHVALAKISDDAKAAIFAGNMARLLGENS